MEEGDSGGCTLDLWGSFYLMYFVSNTDYKRFFQDQCFGFGTPRFLFLSWCFFRSKSISRYHTMQRFKKQEHQRIDFKLLAKAQTRRDEEEQAGTVTASAQDCKRRGVFFFLQ